MTTPENPAAGRPAGQAGVRFAGDALLAPDVRFVGDAIGATDVQIDGRRLLLTPHNCFACGELNANGLQLELHARDGHCWTELTLPERFEGWEGIAHGGIVCTILDEVMAWAIVGRDAWGVTARMTVDFKRPISVGTRIRGEGWVVRARRNLFDTAARIVDLESGIELATAAAVYMAVPEERTRELKARYAYRIVADVDASGIPDKVDS